MIYFNEEGYLRLLSETLQCGVDVPDRTGVGTLALFDAKLVFDEDFPFSTVRPMPARMAFEEFWMFLRGITNTKMLEEKGVNFWKTHTSREFLDKRGLHHLNEGEMGWAYGAQFRNYGSQRSNEGVDQLVELIDGLKNDPYSRRHYVSFWNPAMSHLMALTPCWHSHQFVVLPGENGKDILHLKMINRSLDIVYGCMFAVQQYRIYQIVMANLLGMEVGTLSCDLSQVHIYKNQIEYAQELLLRDLGRQGRFCLNKNVRSLTEMLSLEWDDFTIMGLEVNNEPFRCKKPPVAM